MVHRGPRGRPGKLGHTEQRSVGGFRRGERFSRLVGVQGSAGTEARHHRRPLSVRRLLDEDRSAQLLGLERVCGGRCDRPAVVRHQKGAADLLGRGRRGREGVRGRGWRVPLGVRSGRTAGAGEARKKVTSERGAGERRRRRGAPGRPRPQGFRRGPGPGRSDPGAGGDLPRALEVAQIGSRVEGGGHAEDRLRRWPWRSGWRWLGLAVVFLAHGSGHHSPQR